MFDYLLSNILLLYSTFFFNSYPIFYPESEFLTGIIFGVHPIFNIIASLVMGKFMVINNTLYDYIIAWNGSTNLLQYLNAKELKIISLTDLFVG